MPVIRYGKTGLLGQVTPTYTPTYTPPQTYTPSPPTYYTPTYTPSPPTYYRPPVYTPTYTPSPPIYSPIYQGTPSYAPPPVGTPIEINPEDAGLQSEGAGPPQLIPVGGGYGGGGAFGPATEEPMTEEVPAEEGKKKTNWLLWLAVVAGVYLFFGGEIP